MTAVMLFIAVFLYLLAGHGLYGFLRLMCIAAGKDFPDDPLSRVACLLFWPVIVIGVELS